MITLPSLDTKSFKEIYEAMRLAVDRCLATDHAYQNPGETVMELFALLTDMQRCYMDYVGDEHYEKCARLLGIEPVEGVYATVKMAFSPETPMQAIPKHFPFSASDIPFETVAYTPLTANKLIAVVPLAEGEWELGFTADLSICPIYRLCVLLDESLGNTPIPLDNWTVMYQADQADQADQTDQAAKTTQADQSDQAVQMAQAAQTDQAVQMARSFQSFHPQLTVSGYSQNMAQDAWLEAEQYSRHAENGYINIAIKQRMKQSEQDSLFWIRLTLDTSSFASTVHLAYVGVNVVEAVQTQHLCDYEDLTADAKGVLLLPSWLALWECFTLLYEQDGVYGVFAENDYTVVPYPAAGYVKCTLTPAAVREHGVHCRVLYYTNAFARKRLFVSDGTPGQAKPLNERDVDGRTLALLAPCGGGRTGLQEWIRKDFFHLSGSHDRHFVYQDGALCFGNHEQGDIPPKGEMMLIRCQTSVFGRGNVRTGEIRALNAANIIPAVGGITGGIAGDGATGILHGMANDRAGNRASNGTGNRASNGTGNRASNGAGNRASDMPSAVSDEEPCIDKAVTPEDYAYITARIPFLPLDRVHAVYENNAVTVYVKPVSNRPFAGLSEAYRQNIAAYLEKYRLITTKVNIKPVSYHPFSIKLAAEFHLSKEHFVSTIIRALREHFPYLQLRSSGGRGVGSSSGGGSSSVGRNSGSSGSGVGSSSSNSGSGAGNSGRSGGGVAGSGRYASSNDPVRRSFGETISYGECYRIFCFLDCIDRINSFEIHYGGTSVREIVLPPGGLAYVDALFINGQEVPHDR